MIATFKKLKAVFSQENFDKYVRMQARQMERARAAGHRDFVGMTDAQIKAGAEFLARANNAGEVFIEA